MGPGGPVRQLGEVGRDDLGEPAVEGRPDALPGAGRVVLRPDLDRGAEHLAGGLLEAHRAAAEEVGRGGRGGDEVVEPQPGAEPEGHGLGEIDPADAEGVGQGRRPAVDARPVIPEPRENHGAGVQPPGADGAPSLDSRPAHPPVAQLAEQVTVNHRVACSSHLGSHSERGPA